jgi:soluble lytic murein transglycosylase
MNDAVLGVRATLCKVFLSVKRIISLLSLVTGASLMLAGPSSAQGVRGIDRSAATWREAVRLRAGLAADSARPEDLLRLAELELALGQPERVHRILTGSAETGEELAGRSTPLLAAAEYELGRFGRAATMFAQAAAGLAGRKAAVMAARAGDAYEKAGQPDSAASYYRLAAESLQEIAGWLALREVRTSPDGSRAVALLARAPREARALAFSVRGEALLAQGDTVGAADALAAAGVLPRAAALAVAVNDTVLARALAYRSMDVADTAVVREGLGFVLEHAPAHTEQEFLTLARAASRLRSYREAVRYAEAAVAAGTPTAAALLVLGDMLVQARQSGRALAAYQRAASLQDERAQVAAYKRGALLLRSGQSARGIKELTAFVARHSGHRLAPVAMYAVADRHARNRRRQAAEALFGEISERWPQHSYASQARFKLAQWALSRRDTAAAAVWYRAEVTAGGLQRNLALFHLATLASDSLVEREIFATLARVDSLGYYGTIARQLAGLPPMRIDPVGEVPLSATAEKLLVTLDLLRETNLLEEATVLINAVVAREGRPPEELLDVAEGLVKRGYMSEGIRLGWRAARQNTLNHPRVLRVIYPWPNRELIEAEAMDHEVDPYLLAALIRQESAFRAEVISHAGAYGFMQLMPATAREVARKLQVEWDPTLLTVLDANLHLGVTHFAHLLRRYGEDVVPALAAYNAGSTPVRRWLARPEANDPVRFVERIPYHETRGYVRTVLRNRSLYRALYPPTPVVTDGMP